MRLIFLLIFVFISFNVFALSKKISLKLPISKELTPLDAYSFDLDSDGNSELIISFIDLKFRNLKSEVKVFSLVNNNWRESTSRFFKIAPSFYHLRNILFIKNSNRIRIVFSDHGPDLPPFVGGESKIYESNNSFSYVDKTEKYLPKAKGQFTFSSSYSRNFIQGKEVFVLNNMKTKTSHLQIYQEMDSKFQEHNSNLAPDILQNCFMNSVFWDYDSSGIEKLILGGCDVQNQHAANFSEYDSVWKFDGTKIKFVQNLDTRIKEGFFGVNFFEKLILKNYEYLIRGSYNNTYQKSVIDIYSYSKNHFEKIHSFHSSTLGQDGFVPSVVLFDVNNDKSLDIVANIKSVDGKIDFKKPNIFALVSNLGSFTIDTSFISDKFDMMNWVVINLKRESFLVSVSYSGDTYFYK